jgi:hypothetical protein
VIIFTTREFKLVKMLFLHIKFIFDISIDIEGGRHFNMFLGGQACITSPLPAPDFGEHFCFRGRVRVCQTASKEKMVRI